MEHINRFERRKTPEEKHKDWMRTAVCVFEGVAVSVISGASLFLLCRGLGIEISPEMLVGYGGAAVTGSTRRIRNNLKNA